MEPSGILFQYNPKAGKAKIWQSTQTPHRSHSVLSDILGFDPTRLRFIAPDVGGAFGMKGSLYPGEALAVWAAFQLGKPVRWIATRAEELLSATLGRGTVSHGWLALTQEGTFTPLSADVQVTLGHWVPNSGSITAWNAGRIFPSGYRIETVDIKTQAVLTDAPPRGIYRGAGRPEANALMERLVDAAAQASGIDQLDLRRRNLLSERQLPHRTVTGNTLDSGDYVGALDRIAESEVYQKARAWREAKRRA